MSLNFLSSNLVMSDIKRFAERIQSEYNVQLCSPYSDKADGEDLWLGYQIQKDGKWIIIKMLYTKNESGDLAIKEKGHVLTIGGEQYGSTFQTLGDVFTLVEIQKNK